MKDNLTLLKTLTLNINGFITPINSIFSLFRLVDIDT